jgi:hypothetical protein
MLCLAEATVPANTREILKGLFSLEAEWNPAGNVVAWLEGPGHIQVTALPTLQEIDASVRGNETKRQPRF